MSSRVGASSLLLLILTMPLGSVHGEIVNTVAVGQCFDHKISSTAPYPCEYIDALDEFAVVDPQIMGEACQNALAEAEQHCRDQSDPETQICWPSGGGRIDERASGYNCTDNVISVDCQVSINCTCNYFGPPAFSTSAPTHHLNPGL